MDGGVWIGIPQFNRLSERDRHRLRDRVRSYVYSQLGYKGSERNPSGYQQKLEYSKAWNRRNKKRINAASNRRRQKIREAGFSTDPHGEFRYKLSKERAKLHGRTNNKTSKIILPF